MRQLSPLLFLGLCLLPLLCAELLPFVRGAHRVRITARLGALATLLASALLVSHFYAQHAERVVAELPLGTSSHALHFAIDALNAPLLPLAAVLILASVLAAPVARLASRDMRAILWLEALLLLTLSSADLSVLALGWIAQVLPLHVLLAGGGARAARDPNAFVTRLYHAAAVLCVLSACLALGYWARPGGFLDLNLQRIDARAVPSQARTLLFALFTFAGLVRSGVFPLHSWLPLAFERGPLLPLALLLSTRTGLYLLARLVIPVFPEASHAAMPALTLIALASALYGAVAALAQTDLRRLLAFWVISQSGIMLTGLVFGDADAISGTLLYWFGFAVSTTGLALLISALEARTGTADIRRFGGLVTRVPMLAACFFLLGLANIAVPGSVAFVAEDMLVHGAMEKHPLLTLVMIVAMVLNAVSFMRAFTAVFLGEPRPERVPQGTLQDLLPREHLTAAALLLMLVLAGVFPNVLIAAQRPAAKSIAFVETLGYAQQGAAEPRPPVTATPVSAR
jgi:NADH-quinone oxidoreductase subunit M